MNSVLSLGLGLLFLTLQTGCLHAPFVGHVGIDLLLPLVLHLIIFRRPAESIFLLVALGLAAGGLSGAPAGLYIIFYLWFLAGVRGGMYFLDAGSYFMFPLFLVLGVVLEHLLFALALSLSASPVRGLLPKALCALVMAPFFLWIFNVLFDRLKRLTVHWDTSQEL